MKHYDFETNANTSGDFANVYAPIFKVPLNKGIGDNWLGDTQFSFDVLWQSSYHYHRKCSYSVSIHQNLQGVEISQLDSGISVVDNGVGYKIVTGEAIYFFVRAGVSNMPVRINVTGSSSKNIFVESLPRENFGIQEGLTFAYEVNQNFIPSRIFHYLEPVALEPVYKGDLDGNNTLIYTYTASKSFVGLVDITATFYSNTHSGNAQIQINDFKERIRETVSLNESADTVKRYVLPVYLNQGQSITIYFAQWTGHNVNCEIKCSVSRGE